MGGKHTTPGTRWKASSGPQKHPAAKVAVCRLSPWDATEQLSTAAAPPDSDAVRHTGTQGQCTKWNHGLLRCNVQATAAKHLDEGHELDLEAQGLPCQLVVYIQGDLHWVSRPGCLRNTGWARCARHLGSATCDS